MIALAEVQRRITINADDEWYEDTTQSLLVEPVLEMLGMDIGSRRTSATRSRTAAGRRPIRARARLRHESRTAFPDAS